jgi:hypothetical protein
MHRRTASGSSTAPTNSSRSALFPHSRWCAVTLTDPWARGVVILRGAQQVSQTTISAYKRIENISQWQSRDRETSFDSAGLATKRRAKAGRVGAHSARSDGDGKNFDPLKEGFEKIRRPRRRSQPSSTSHFLIVERASSPTKHLGNRRRRRIKSATSTTTISAVYVEPFGSDPCARRTGWSSVLQLGPIVTIGDYSRLGGLHVSSKF